MNAPSHDRPLTDAEIETLETRLEAVDPEDSMAVEELDGFLAALACCPEPVPREEWLPLVLGDSPRARAALRGETEGEDAALLRLIERHRASVASMLYDGEGFAPVLAYDEDGNAWGNAWAIGFARGMALRPDAWAPLEDDDDYADALDPMMRLVADAQQDDDEPDEDEPDEAARIVPPPASRAGAPQPGRAEPPRGEPDDDDDDGQDWEPIADDERESVIHEMLDGVQDVYDFFREARERALAPATVRRDGAKVGRNDPCPCGSGRKFKQCHGSGTVH
jgi:uncharacterized protein